MIQTLSNKQAIEQLMQDEYAGWSYAGARALVEYLEALEEDTETPIEFDRVVLRCDYSEYKSSVDAYQDHTGAETATLTESESLEWLEYRTQVIQFEGGVIIQQF